MQHCFVKAYMNFLYTIKHMQYVNIKSKLVNKFKQMEIS